MKKNIFLHSTFTDSEDPLKESIDSKCMYCGSTYYGSGCIYSVHGIHVHTGSDGKCIYCGSLYYGSGCIFNPHNNMHIHGTDVTTSIRETTRKTLEFSYIFERLLFDIKDTTAYKLNLIDENGKQLRVPVSLYESQLMSPLSKALYKIRKFLPEDTLLIKESYKHFDIDTTSSDVEMFKEEIEFTQEIKYATNLIVATLKKYHDIITPEKIEKVIENTILECI